MHSSLFERYLSDGVLRLFGLSIVIMLSDTSRFVCSVSLFFYHAFVNSVGPFLFCHMTHRAPVRPHCLPFLCRYFRCSDQHGLFVRPANVTLLEPAAAAAPVTAPAGSSVPDSVDATAGATGVEPEDVAGGSTSATNGNDGGNENGNGNDSDSDKDDNTCGMEEDGGEADNDVGYCGDAKAALDSVVRRGVATSNAGATGIGMEEVMGGSSSTTTTTDDDDNDDNNLVGEDGDGDGDGDGDVKAAGCDDPG